MARSPLNGATAETLSSVTRCQPFGTDCLPDHRSTVVNGGSQQWSTTVNAAGPPVNGGGQRRLTVVDHRSTTAGPPAGTTVNVLPPIQERVIQLGAGSGLGPGKIGSWAGSDRVGSGSSRVQVEFGSGPPRVSHVCLRGIHVVADVDNGGDVPSCILELMTSWLEAKGKSAIQTSNGVCPVLWVLKEVGNTENPSEKHYHRVPPSIEPHELGLPKDYLKWHRLILRQEALKVWFLRHNNEEMMTGNSWLSSRKAYSKWDGSSMSFGVGFSSSIEFVAKREGVITIYHELQADGKMGS
ncbi:hypothetical protein Tco_0168652 [Tanacetum coccineum]